MSLDLLFLWLTMSGEKKRFRDYYYNLLMLFKKADNKKGCGESAEIKIQKLNVIHVRKPLKC